ncbi:fumarylacetoacetate hydrolase domain-containing protein 2, partial [Tupaia chinensis]|uniref:fumarylacetoacetate hydrolase domain-containing protein 2 n=1 Tax=Tupaia chinensis TaxID=246437 RepID=UPI0003C91737
TQSARHAWLCSHSGAGLHPVGLPATAWSLLLHKSHLPSLTWLWYVLFAPVGHRLNPTARGPVCSLSTERALEPLQLTAPLCLQEVDWEVELAVVIGKKGKHIKATDAMAHVAGFTVAHDVSARDWQMRRNGKQWLLGKTFDTFCPLGPALVTKDSIADPHNLKICCRLNGEVVQSSNTNQMVFKTEELIAWVSQFVTLYPGDIFLTGTPPGVGVFRKPPVFLKKGDEVQCEIEDLGVIINKVV